MTEWTGRFLAWLGWGTICLVVAGVGLWLGRFRSERAETTWRWLLGWCLGGAVVAGIQAVVQSPIWWVSAMRDAFAEPLPVVGGALGAGLAVYHLKLRRAAEGRSENMAGAGEQGDEPDNPQERRR